MATVEKSLKGFFPLNPNIFDETEFTTIADDLDVVVSGVETAGPLSMDANDDAIAGPSNIAVDGSSNMDVVKPLNLNVSADGPRVIKESCLIL